MQSEVIKKKLIEIEEKMQIKILHAVESGSRCWGFASPDSDYDVRFIYVRKMQDYLRLDELKDSIEWELNEVLDINGWDLKKTLQLVHKSNVTPFEWAASPIVYHTTDEWKQITGCFGKYYSTKSAMYHYYGTAIKNKSEYLKGEKVSYKKYLYVLRPLFSCKWIEEKGTPPPMIFNELKESLVKDKCIDSDIENAVDKLLVLKKQMSESQKWDRIPVLDDYIKTQIDYDKEMITKREDDRCTDWDTLNHIFCDYLISST